MNRTKSEETKSGVSFLLFMTWLVYSISYLGKVNYSATITQVIEFYNVTKAEAGIVPTFFFFAYGIGQVVNGLLCKKYNMKWMIFISLFLSGIINLVIAVTDNFAIIKWLWMINGFLLSILWPTLIRLLSETLSQKDLGKSSVVMGTTVAAGTIVIYALSSIYVAFGNFKLAFYTAAFTGITVSVIWLLVYKKAVSIGEKQMSAASVSEAAEATKEKGPKAEKSVISALCILCFCAVGVNLIKDGLTTWVPSILKEEGSVGDSLSILLTLFLPIVAIFGNVFALSFHKRVPDYITHCLIIFLVTGGIILVVIGSLSIKNVILMLIGMIAASYLAASLNSLLTSIYPMFMREKINSGMCAGIVNGFCYLGSTISSYGLGLIADNFGWNAVFLFLFGACIVISVVCGIHIILKHAFEKQG